MKKYLFLITGGIPTNELEAKENITQYGEYMGYLNQNNFFVSGAPLEGETTEEVTKRGISNIVNSIAALKKCTGYMIIQAADLDGARKAAIKNPVLLKSGRVFIIPLKS